MNRMLQTRRGRIIRTALVTQFYSILVTLGLYGLYRYNRNIRYLKGCFGLVGIVFFISIILWVYWSVEHGLKYGFKYAWLHSKMYKSINRALYDSNFYTERIVLLKKCAVIPRIKITMNESLDEGVIQIGNSIKLDKRLDELPISSALLKKYVLTASYISDDGNDYIYEFEKYGLEQLEFKSYLEFKEYSLKIGEYDIFLDSRYIVPIFHALIIGQTGSGKSYCLYNLILQMISKPTPYELYIADPKYSGLFVLGHAINKERVASSVDEIIQLLQVFNERMQTRKEEFSGKLLSKLDSDYRDFNLTPICLIIDEYSSFRASLGRYDKKTRDLVDEIIGNVIREGRQRGCFCIISQQQTNASNLSTELKENMPFKLILGMAERQTYITALGQYPDAAKRRFDVGQGLLVYPKIATPEIPRITSVATLDFDILDAIESIKRNNDIQKERAGGM